MGNEGRSGIRLGIQGTKPTEIGVLNIQDYYKEIFSDLSVLKFPLESDFADKFLLVNVIDFNVGGVGRFLDEIEEISVPVNGNRIFDIINFKGLFVLSCLFNAVDSDQLLSRVCIWTDYF